MRTVPDPRSPRKKKHDLAALLVCLVAGYVSGHTTIRRCLSWCRRHLKWLQRHLPLEGGIASVATASRMLSSIDEELFLCAFLEWIGEILSARGLHIAIDGKAIKAAAEKVKGSRTPMILSAIDTATGLVLAQLAIENKENEITQIPELLKLLDIRGSVITIDAIGTQTDLMRNILNAGGHFELLVKKNWPVTHEEITRFFEELEQDWKNQKKLPGYRTRYPELQKNCENCEYTEKNRDRYEYRSYSVCHDISVVPKAANEWPFLKSIGYIKQTRILKVEDAEGNDITPLPEEFLREGTFRQPNPISSDRENADVQAVGVISDMVLTAADMGKYKRNHWAVENRLHHVLDDTFREDRSPAKKSKTNLALIRKIAYNILRIAMILEDFQSPMTEMMDEFADDQGMIEKYIFNGIPSFY